MKLTLLFSVLMAMLVSGCASTQCASTQCTNTTAPTSVNESSKHTPYQGTIMAIDMSANTITIQTDQGTMTMTVNESTKFRGGSSSLSDFKVGDKISGMFMMDDSGKMMAVSIRPYSSKG
jgi:hypothetical protein